MIYISVRKSRGRGKLPSISIQGFSANKFYNTMTTTKISICNIIGLAPGNQHVTRSSPDYIPAACTGKGIVSWQKKNIRTDGKRMGGAGKINKGVLFLFL
jgi:hypothetical protein